VFTIGGGGAVLRVNDDGVAVKEGQFVEIDVNNVDGLDVLIIVGGV
jgi:hypothetical protein